METNEIRYMSKDMEKPVETVTDNNHTHENGYTYKIYPISIKNKDDSITKIEFKIFNTIAPQRLDGENYAEYKFRRKIVNKQLKKHLKGTLIWDSSNKNTLTIEKALELHAKHLENQINIPHE